MVDLIQLVFEFVTKVFEKALKEYSPKGRIFIRSVSLSSKMPQLILLLLPNRVVLLFVSLGQ